MAIRWKAYAPNTILKAVEVQDLADNGVIQLDTAADLASADLVNANVVYVAAESKPYVRQAPGVGADKWQVFSGGLSGLGGWAEFTSTTGSPTKHEYTDADGNAMTMYVFTGDGTFTSTDGVVSVQAFGGGGGGAGRVAEYGGGGSGGGHVLTAAVVTAGTPYNVRIGTGGVGGNTGNPMGDAGGATECGPVYAIGGGGGAARPANPGGPGGGGSSASPAPAVNTDQLTQGGPGAANTGGGGGGVGGASTNENGGPGITPDGLTYTVGAGGGGAHGGAPGDDSAGGGVNSGSPQAAPANRAGGGGGLSTAGSVNLDGGAGGSGLAIIRVPRDKAKA